MAGLVEPSPVELPLKSPAAESPVRALTAAGVREMAAIAGLLTLADLTIYRGAGFAGLAALFVGGPLLLLVGTRRFAPRLGFWLVSVMLMLLAARLVWMGSILGVVCGFVLIVSFAVAIGGQQPHVSTILAGGCQLVVAGLVRFAQGLEQWIEVAPRLPRVRWLNYLLPAAALILFGTLFVQANPDLARSIAERWQRAMESLTIWLQRWHDHGPEIAFWLATAYIAVGLLRPLLPQLPAAASQPEEPGVPFAEAVTQPAPLFAALRNTLWAVIGLFAVYLVFEFATLWFRTFPVGFYYAGYAHQGAAWLTAALALATLALSLIFRGDVLSDPRLPKLRLLAWIWSAENFLLAVSVYHRMSIYIDFNGMTRMRTIGLFGITTVVAGFVLVLWKLRRNRSFAWLIQRQLWALAVAIYLYALTPVDTLVHTYNVRQILRGDLAPSVQITEHPISTEGYLVLQPLAECQDPIIRDGIRALLAEQQLAAEERAKERRELGWTTFQMSDDWLDTDLRASAALWADFRDDARRAAALAQFRQYAYQWY